MNVVVVIAIVLITTGIGWELFFRWRSSRPETDEDRYCAWADQELDARENCRPHGSVERIS